MDSLYFTPATPEFTDNDIGTRPNWRVLVATYAGEQRGWRPPSQPIGGSDVT
jgi:hypothetical protein